MLGLDQRIEKADRLRHESDLPTSNRRQAVRCELLALKQNAAVYLRVVGQDTKDGEGQDALPGAAGTDHGDNLALSHVQGHATQDGDSRHLCPRFESPEGDRESLHRKQTADGHHES